MKQDFCRRETYKPLCTKSFRLTTKSRCTSAGWYVGIHGREGEVAGIHIKLAPIDHE